ncbi:hypothetical protein PV11_09622 [Exophiala sideris]|uniref:Uncharacterized protein n=1 Tax=Exophiala sideris TaxID=1016849 RepID=A0A0D1YSB8_9EURO|nr:hypothetical protein PV11_09622 [Exophiala sideris]
MPFYTLDDLRNENDPFLHRAQATQAQSQAQGRNPFAGMGQRLDELAPPMRQRPEERDRGRRGQNDARRARARSPSCDTCGYARGGSDDDDDFEDGQDLVLLLQDDDTDHLQYDLMNFDAWRGDRYGEPLMIMEIGGGGPPPAYEHLHDPAASAGPERGGEHRGNQGAGEDMPMFRRRRGGISGPPQRDGAEGEGQADPYGMGVGPASDWVDGRRRHAQGPSRGPAHGHDRGYDRGGDDYGRVLDLLRRARRF